MEIKTYMTRGVANLLVGSGKIQSLFVLVLNCAIMEYSVILDAHCYNVIRYPRDRKSVV